MARQYFFSPEEITSLNPVPGIFMNTVTGDQMTMSIVDLDPNSVLPVHSHPHEQIGMLIEGELEFTIGEETRTVKPGDVWHIPGNVEHGAVAGDMPTKAVDVFYPIREDYRLK